MRTHTGYIEQRKQICGSPTRKRKSEKKTIPEQHLACSAESFLLFGTLVTFFNQQEWRRENGRRLEEEWKRQLPISLSDFLFGFWLSVETAQ